MKREIREMLAQSRYGEIVSFSEGRGQRVIRFLVSMTYDKGDVLCWRAIRAAGEVSATMPVPVVRETIQKLLWMMRDESGGNPWSAPELIAEIVANNPAPFEDIVPILASFHEETFFLPAVLCGLERIAAVRPDLVRPSVNALTGYADTGSAEVRGLLIRLLGRLGAREHRALAEKYLPDTSPVRIFDGEALVTMTVGALSEEAVKRINGGGQ